MSTLRAEPEQAEEVLEERPEDASSGGETHISRRYDDGYMIYDHVSCIHVEHLMIYLHLLVYTKDHILNIADIDMWRGADMETSVQSEAV